MISTCIMTLVNEVNHEKDVLKAIEAILCSIGFNKCNRLVYVTVVISFYYFVCKQSLLLYHMICYSRAFHILNLKMVLTQYTLVSIYVVDIILRMYTWLLNYSLILFTFRLLLNKF